VKKGIHPKYYPEAKVICACGNTWTTGSTQEVIRTEMCSACHPFFTGEQRIVDTAGQVDRFQRRQERAGQIAEEVARRRLEKEKKEESLFELVGEEAAEKPVLAEAPPKEVQPVGEQAAIGAKGKPRARRTGRPRAVKPKGEAKGKRASQAVDRKKAAKVTEKPKAEGETKSPVQQAPEPAAAPPE